MKLKTSKLKKNRENAGDQGTIGRSFASDWLRRWRVLSTDQSQSEVKQHQSSSRLNVF